MSFAVGVPSEWPDEHGLRLAIEQSTDVFNTRALTRENVASLIEEHCADIVTHPHLAAYSLAALRRLAERIRESGMR